MLRPPPSSDLLAAALRESEQKFSGIFQSAPFGISLATLPEQIVVDVNPAWERLFGFAREEAVGKTFTDLQITDEAEDQHSSKQGRIRYPVRDAETAARTKSGAVRIVCSSHDQVTLASGQYLLSTLQDVTDRVQADSELRYANETINEILHSITDAFCAFDRNWLYTYVNDEAVRLLGKSREQLIGYSP
jgi:PAS domain S-box-containing protein